MKTGKGEAPRQRPWEESASRIETRLEDYPGSRVEVVLSFTSDVGKGDIHWGKGQEFALLRSEVK
jgi:hypothetical protein